MVQLPPQFQSYSVHHIWGPIKDEIRRLAHSHGLANINGNALRVHICVGHGNRLFANCAFRDEDDASEVFSKYIEGR